MPHLLKNPANMNVAETDFGAQAGIREDISAMTTEGRSAPSGPRGRVTLAEVSDMLGLSKGTVSRALNGYPDIAEGTRLRVRTVAERMGYRPLSQAQGIRTGRTRSIGLVLQTDEHDSHAPFLTDFLAGVTTTASREDWTLTVATAASDADMAETLRRLVAERKADGFILPRTLVHDPRIETLESLGVPFVLFGRTGSTAPLASFDIRGEAAMQEAVQRLARLGHRRIGFVGGAERYMFAQLRLTGYRSGLSAAGLPFDAALVRTGTRTTADGEAATIDLLAQPAPPTAIVFATDITALGAYAVAERLGLRIGHHLSVISYDGISAGGLMRPPLTTYRVDTRGAGARLAELLIRQIRGERPEKLRELAPAEFVAGGSDAPPAATSEALAATVAQSLKNQETVSIREEPR